MVRRVLVSKDPEVASSWRHLGISGLEAEKTAGTSIMGICIGQCSFCLNLTISRCRGVTGTPHAGGEHDGRAVLRAFIWRRPTNKIRVFVSNQY